MYQYKEFQDRFKKMSDDQLIDAFNREVGNKGWTNTRGSYLKALHQEFEARGYDYSTVGDERSLSLKRKIKLAGKKIEFAKTSNKLE